MSLYLQILNDYEKEIRECGLEDILNKNHNNDTILVILDKLLEYHKELKILKQDYYNRKIDKDFEENNDY